MMFLYPIGMYGRIPCVIGGMSSSSVCVDGGPEIKKITYP